VSFEKRWLSANLFGFLKIAQTNPYETIALLEAKSHSFTQLEDDLCEFLARRWGCASGVTASEYLELASLQF
jgi:hypothetical protein